jgi:hypothetical protein
LGIKISLYQGTKHSGGSQAINAGVDLKVIQEMMGHKDPRTTARHLKVCTERLKSFGDRDNPQSSPRAANKKDNLLNLEINEAVSAGSNPTPAAINKSGQWPVVT